MTSFVEALKAEIEHLERQLEESPTYIRLRELRRISAMYTDSSVTSPQPPPAQSHARPFQSGISAEILRVAKDVLTGRAEPTSTKSLMETLAERGVRVGGTVPQNNVSSMLSKSADFVSHGRSGWTLSVPDRHDTEKAGDGAASTNPSPAIVEHRTDHPAEPRAQGREAVPGGGT